MWFSPNQAMTKQRLLNFFVGPRGDGKTTGARNYAIEQWEKAMDKGEPYEIGYIRRYKGERAESRKKLFADVYKFNYPYHFSVSKDNNVTINGEQFCHFFALSTDFRIKGAAWDNIRLLIFDEFLVDTKKARYLPDEVNSFLALYDTVARPSDPARKPVPVIFLANSFSINNPYFNYFNVRFASGKNVFMGKDIYAEIIRDHEFTEHAKSTRWGELIKNTEYGKHAIENDFILDDSAFIYPKYEKGQFLFTLYINGNSYGCWANWKEGVLYISPKYDQNSVYNYVFTREDLKPNYLTAKRFKETFHGKLVKECYNNACVYFETLKAKQDFLDVARLANL